LNNNLYSTIVDINECSSHNGGCNHRCTNSHGSFKCSCNKGYSLQSNKKTCVGKYIVMLIIEDPNVIVHYRTEIKSLFLFF